MAGGDLDDPRRVPCPESGGGVGGREEPNGLDDLGPDLVEGVQGPVGPPVEEDVRVVPRPVSLEGSRVPPQP